MPSPSGFMPIPPRDSVGLAGDGDVLVGPASADRVWGTASSPCALSLPLAPAARATAAA